jgi:hypothetical protein
MSPLSSWVSPPIYNPAIPSWVYKRAGLHLPRVVPLEGYDDWVQMSIRHRSGRYESFLSVTLSMYESHGLGYWLSLFRTFEGSVPRD